MITLDYETGVVLGYREGQALLGGQSFSSRLIKSAG
jgi:hypothetical protein